MAEISYRRHRFPPVIIQHAVWVYLRFTLSYRDVEELLAERGLEISYETVRCWVLKFGPVIARRLRRHRPRPPTGWMKTNSRIGGLAATRSISWSPSRSAPVSPWRTDKRACQEKTPAGEPGFQGIAIEQGDLRSIADT